MSSGVHVVCGDVEVVLLDRDGVIVATNRAWLDFCRDNGGHPDLVGPGTSYLAACDVVADEDPTAAQVATAVRAAVRGDLPVSLRIRIPCHAPQAERWFDVLISSRRDEDGECIGGSLTFAPAPPPRSGSVTPWHMFDLVPDPVFVVDEWVRIEYLNPAARALLGYDEAQAADLTFTDLDPDLDVVRARTELLALRTPGSTASRLRELRRADGSRIPVEAHLGSVVDDAGAPRFVVTVHDLRPRRAAEALLQAQEESLRVAFEQAPVGAAVVSIGQDGRRTVLRANGALADLLGTTVEDLVGRDLAEFSLPENTDHDLRIVRELTSGARRAYSRRKKYRRADGGGVWLEVRVSRVDVPGIEGPTTLAHFVDVTERHLAGRLRARESAADAAIAEITTAVLAGSVPERLHQLVADAVARVFDAENVTLILPDPATGAYRVVGAVGPASTRLLTGQTPVSQALVRQLVEAGSLAVPEAGSLAVPEAGPDVTGELKPLLGPGAAARLAPAGPAGVPGSGLITVARPRGGEVFAEAEVAVLVRLAQQVALALELGRARPDRQSLAVLEDRQRIARDLHDTVIQDLIAIGMQLDAASATEPDPERARWDQAVVDQLEEAVRRLRSSVFDLRAATPVRSVAGTVSAVAKEAARALGHEPFVRVEGDDAGLPGVVADAVVIVLREALSNVARHAHATATKVSLSVTDTEVTLIVDDDGVGVRRRAVPGDGLANIRHRAAALHGTAEITERPGGGSRVLWTCPL